MPADYRLAAALKLDWFFQSSLASLREEIPVDGTIHRRPRLSPRSFLVSFSVRRQPIHKRKPVAVFYNLNNMCKEWVLLVRSVKSVIAI